MPSVAACDEPRWRNAIGLERLQVQQRCWQLQRQARLPTVRQSRGFGTPFAKQR
jgi:hypothetical protein